MTKIFPLLLAAAMASGCQVAHVGKESVLELARPEVEALETRQDVIQKLGLPSRVLEVPEGLRYEYRGSLTRGIAFGFVFAGMGFLMQHDWDSDDDLEFTFDDQDRIVSVRDPRMYPGAEYRLWCFGE